MKMMYFCSEEKNFERRSGEYPYFFLKRIVDKFIV
jgi:hypothetical protein